LEGLGRRGRAEFNAARTGPHTIVAFDHVVRQRGPRIATFEPVRGDAGIAEDRPPATRSAREMEIPVLLIRGVVLWGVCVAVLAGGDSGGLAEGAPEGCGVEISGGSADLLDRHITGFEELFREQNP
jgi:hypothetical protein